ncbi:MAG: hypothetical protein HY717_17210 [Planctomycetes bacterium]|nr:hypothetical protein [Planctomycetota bacterium]
MYDFANFTLRDMVEFSAALRRLGAGAESMEEVAGRIVHCLYEQLADRKTRERSCALVRFFKTHPFGELDAELRRFARKMLGDHPEPPAMKCLVLLATAGDKPEWNSRKNSSGHKAIPLPSEKVVTQFPMISQLVKQFGLEVSAVLEPDQTLLLDLEQKTYNVFHIREALGNPFVPAQAEFVVPFGIKSVIGFGGMLPSGDLFATILFSKVQIPRETADQFKTLALSAKVALLPFVGGAIFN